MHAVAEEVCCHVTRTEPQCMLQQSVSAVSFVSLLTLKGVCLCKHTPQDVLGKFAKAQALLLQQATR